MSSSNNKYDVFISFRGEDVRSNFLSHLSSELEEKSIITYTDYLLDRGEEIWPALETAIENSSLSIVVFSENYATSKWCLVELVKILQCRKGQGQVVIPVFYKTEPTHIRKQTGSYEKAFAKYERDLSSDFQSQVLKWRAALTEAADIAGWNSQNYEKESQFIKDIVKDVLQKRSLRYPEELAGIVGSEVNYRNVELLMKQCQVIGIWGMGGIGKTTIAKVLFASYFPQYDKVSFMSDVKDYSYDKLRCELLNEEISKCGVVGFTFHMKRFIGKKVLIVLDNADMSNEDQIEDLCREYKDLSPDSRLIITTREKKLLKKRVDRIYKVREWKRQESLEFFCLKAFNKTSPRKGYEDLTNRAVTYAGGVPLALTVLGTYLHPENKEFWEDTLEKLKDYPNERIQAVLKVSYDRLNPRQQEIFLDIAFFFRGESKDHVIRILDACGYRTSNEINLLEQKALITISNSNIIHMHDLLQQMGLEIEHQYSKDRGGHRRLRNAKEVHDVLENIKERDTVEGIILDLSEIEKTYLSVDTFKKMKNLRFLKFFSSSNESFGNVHLPLNLEPFSKKLRYFEWNGYPLASLPTPFYAKLLVEICLPHSHIKQLWQETQG